MLDFEKIERKERRNKIKEPDIELQHEAYKTSKS